jgi:hypothetical protein
VHDGFHPHRDGEKDKAVWLPCTTKDNTLHVNTAIRLTTGAGKAEGAGQASSAGSITVDSIDGRFKQHLNMAWKKC